MTLNATAAVYTHSNVKSVIERTESLADDASRVVNGPVDLVSTDTSILINFPTILENWFLFLALAGIWVFLMMAAFSAG